MPWAYDPPEGFIVTANQAVTASPTPFLTTQWDYGFRSRIRTLLEKEDKVTPQRMAQIQGDTHSQFAPTLVRTLLKVDLGNPVHQEAQDLLRDWDFSSRSAVRGQRRRGLLQRGVVNLMELTFNDELPDELRANGGDQWMQTITTLLAKPRSAWWDKLTPGVTEGQAEIMRLALVEARLQLTKEVGKDPSGWEWGALHELSLTHKVLGGDSVPGVVGMLFNRGPVALPGGPAIVNANGWDASPGLRGELGAVDAHGRRPRQPRGPRGSTRPATAATPMTTTTTRSRRGRRTRRTRGRTRRRPCGRPEGRAAADALSRRVSAAAPLR